MAWTKPFAKVTRERLRLDDAEVLGANAIDYSSTADQSAKLQAAIAFAAAATGSDGEILLTGSITCTSPITLPNTRLVRIQGVGADKDRCALKFTTDFGPGVPSLRSPQSIKYDIRDLAMIGPGSTVSLGDTPAHSMGFFTGTSGIMDNVLINSFGQAVGLVNDHQEFHSCDLRGNGMGVNFMDNPGGGLGDLYFERCYLTDQSRASIGLTDSNAIANARWIQGHCGAAPYGVLRYPAISVSAKGASGQANLTEVALPSWFPTGSLVGASISGTGIPVGTTVLSATNSSGFYWNLTLSANTTAQVTMVYFPLMYYSASGGTGSNVITANIPDLFPMGSIDGVTLKGTNLPANTQVVSHSGSAGAYSLTLNNTPTGAVTGIAFDPRGVGMAGNVFDNWSWEYAGNAQFYDEGRNGGSFSVIRFSSPGEFGTGGSGKWPGKPYPVGMIDVGSISQMTWEDHGPGLDANNPGTHATVSSNIISGIQIDNARALMDNVTTYNSKMGLFLRVGATSPLVDNISIGKRGVNGMFASALIASEAITQYDVVETDWSSGTLRLRLARGDNTNKTLGVAAHTCSAGEACIYFIEADQFFVKVRNKTGSSIASNVWLKPDTANFGGVVAATNAADAGVFAKNNNGGPITAGTSGQAIIRVPS